MGKRGYRKVYPLLLTFVFFSACYGQEKSSQAVSVTKDSAGDSKTKPEEQTKIYGPLPDPFPDGEVSQYIRRMFQDSKGNIWFGTNGDGVCRYDGKSLTYFTPTEGFAGSAVRGIIEDEYGNLWFATDGGVSRYDAERANHPCNKNTCKHDLQKPEDLKQHTRELVASFTNLTTKDGLSHNQVWSILQDKAGDIWIGTEGGVCRYNTFVKTISPLNPIRPFQLPEVDLSRFPEAYPAPKLVNCIYEDKAGNLWFASNGNGVYRYDGSTLTNLSEKEGLCNNFVQSILEDKNGLLWFCTRFGGLCRYDPATGGFTDFSKKAGLTVDFAWILMEDKSGSFWLGTAGGGAYRFDENSSFHFTDKEGLTNKYVQSFLEDKNGNIWLGASGGLFRYDGKGFIHVKRGGPWP